MTKHIHIEPSVLFTRLVVLIERSPDVNTYFNYELTPIPTALFKENFMRKPYKAALATALIERGKKKEGKSCKRTFTQKKPRWKTKMTVTKMIRSLMIQTT